jgi:phage tail-like protein
MPATGDRKQPTPVTNFRLTITGIGDQKYFREFSGFSSAFNVTEDTWEGEQAKPEFAKFPMGAAEWEPISVERSLDKNMALWDWFKTCHIEGKWEDQIREGSLEILNQKGEPILKYEIIGCWPCAYSVGDFDYGESSTAATERIEIVHEGIRRIA